MINTNANIKIYSFKEIQKLPKQWTSPQVELPDFGIEVLCHVIRAAVGEKTQDRHKITGLFRHSVGNGHDYIWSGYEINDGKKQFKDRVIEWQPMPDIPKPEKRHSMKSIDMKKFGFSNVGDLSAMVRELENVFKKYFPGKTPAFGIAFTLYPNFEVHWAANIPRDISIQIFREVADKMETKSN